VLTSIIEGRGAVYVSAPITSGRRLVEWGKEYHFDKADPEHQDEFQREVVGPNREHARQIVRQLRREFPGVLIDPTAMEDIEGWTQDDYRYLWGRIIAHSVKTVVYIDGWQYSNGCAYEFLVAWRCPVETLNEELQPLSLEEGLQLIRAAIAELQEAGQKTAFLERVAEELESLKAAEEVCAE
jgi:hypothetical protein